MPLKVAVEMQSLPENLKPSVKRLNTNLYSDFMQLSLKNITTQQVFTVSPYHSTYIGMRPLTDKGRNVVLLNGGPIGPWQVTFPLVRARDVLEPGLYECKVEYSFPEQPSQWWDKTKDWKSFAFWSGTVVSGPFQFTILKETPETKVFSAPKRLRYFEKDRKVGYTKQDAVRVEVPVRNGFSICTQVFRNAGSYTCYGGLPWPDDINGICGNVDFADHERLSYVIRVVETADPSQHLHRHTPFCPGYKVLWEQTFTVTRPEGSGTQEQLGR